jgi:hypothetical protein
MMLKIKTLIFALTALCSFVMSPTIADENSHRGWHDSTTNPFFHHTSNSLVEGQPYREMSIPNRLGHHGYPPQVDNHTVRHEKKHQSEHKHRR